LPPKGLSSPALKYRLARGSCPLVKYRQEKVPQPAGDKIRWQIKEVFYD